MIWHSCALVAFSCFTGLDHCITVVGSSQFLNDSNVKNGLEKIGRNNEPPEMDVFRLPTSVIPVSYNLELATNFVSSTYFGRVDIIVRASVTTFQIVLNAKDLLVTRVEVIDQKLNKSLNVVGYYLVKKN